MRFISRGLWCSRRERRPSKFFSHRTAAIAPDAELEYGVAAEVCRHSTAPTPVELAATENYAGRLCRADASERLALPGAGAVCDDVAEEGEDDEDPLPAGDAAPAGVPEDDVEKGRQRQEDDPQDRPDDRAERTVDPGREDPHQRDREAGRKERDQYEDAAHRGLFDAREASPAYYRRGAVASLVRRRPGRATIIGW